MIAFVDPSRGLKVLCSCHSIARGPSSLCRSQVRFLAIIPFIGWLVVPLVMLFGLGAELIARKEFYTTARAQGLI